MKGTRRQAPSKARIAEAVEQAARQAGVRPEQVRERRAGPGGNGNLAVSRARWMAWRTLLAAGFNMHAVAVAWGCHHTSIIHGLRRLAETDDTGLTAEMRAKLGIEPQPQEQQRSAA